MKHQAAAVHSTILRCLLSMLCVLVAGCTVPSTGSTQPDGTNSDASVTPTEVAVQESATDGDAAQHEETGDSDEGAVHDEEETHDDADHDEADHREADQDETGTDGSIDITNAILTKRSGNCADYVATYTSENVLDIANNTNFDGNLVVTVNDGECTFSSNAIPNHDFNDTNFVNQVSEQDQVYSVTTDPQPASTTTGLSLLFDNAILLNGVKVDLLAAGCYGVGDGLFGCNDMSNPWRYDPPSPFSPDFLEDAHNGHAQPDGTYHYHANPNALFDDSSVSPVIGFAADGFPIFGSYFDDNGTIRKATSSYQLRSGARPSGDGNPGGTYDGSFIQDYEYVEGLGDLDECNGMTIDGVYGYFVTDEYPHIIGCFRGTPDESFQKRPDR